MTSEELVRRAWAGDGASREALARAWLPRAYGVALALTGRAAEAEDLTQEAFLRVFRSLASLRKPSRFGPWLLQIVRNAARDVHRRPPHPESLGERAAQVADREDPHQGPNAAVDAWRALPEMQRLVCWLQVVEGVPLREIAELLGSSKSAVHRLHAKGIDRLRKDVARC